MLVTSVPRREENSHHPTRHAEAITVKPTRPCGVGLGVAHIVVLAPRADRLTFGRVGNPGMRR